MSGVRIDPTGPPETIRASDGRLTLRVAIRIKRRGSRKAVTLPNGEALVARPAPGTTHRHRCNVKFRQFLLRGLANVRNEWTLVCLAWNLKRMAVLRPTSTSGT